MGVVLDGALFAIPLLAAEAGLGLYVASFFGYCLEDGIGYLIIVGIVISLSSIPTTIRDRKFFLQHWVFGLTALRYRFPFQFFPARRVGRLDGLAWGLLAVLMLHVAWFVMSAHAHNQETLPENEVLRIMSLIVTYSGILAALGWKYPPTELPRT